MQIPYQDYDALPVDFAHMLLHPPRGVSEVEVGVLRVAIGTDVDVELLLASLGVHHAWQGGQDERAHPKWVHLCEKTEGGTENDDHTSFWKRNIYTRWKPFYLSAIIILIINNCTNISNK